MLTESQRYVKECQGKKSFRSQAKANKFQRESRSKALFTGDRLRAYPCTWCSPPNGPEVWHLGHAGIKRWATNEVAS